MTVSDTQPGLSCDLCWQSETVDVFSDHRNIEVRELRPLKRRSSQADGDRPWKNKTRESSKTSLEWLFVNIENGD